MNKEFDIRAHLLPGLPVEEILACYAAAAGNEIDSGKFGSIESSAALAANTFGFFLRSPQLLPAFPDTQDLGWPASMVTLEGVLRIGSVSCILDCDIATAAGCLANHGLELPPRELANSVEHFSSN